MGRERGAGLEGRGAAGWAGLSGVGEAGGVSRLPEVPTGGRRTGSSLGSFGWLRLAWGLPSSDLEPPGKAGRRKPAVSGQGAHLTPPPIPQRPPDKVAKRLATRLYFGREFSPHLHVLVFLPSRQRRAFRRAQMSQQTKIDPLQGGLCGAADILMLSAKPRLPCQAPSGRMFGKKCQGVHFSLDLSG